MNQIKINIGSIKDEPNENIPYILNVENK